MEGMCSTATASGLFLRPFSRRAYLSRYLDICIASAVTSRIGAHTVGACFSGSNLVQALVAFPACFHHEEDAAGSQHQNADDSQRKRPAHVVVLPVGHPISSVATSTKRNNGDQSAKSYKQTKIQLIELAEDYTLDQYTYIRGSVWLRWTATAQRTDRRRDRIQGRQMSSQRKPTAG